MSRPDRDPFWFSIAAVVATRATCPRAAIGAILVKWDRIIATGFNGAPSGDPHCLERDQTLAEHLALDHCDWSQHAERNALRNSFIPVEGATIYVVGPRPICPNCDDRLRACGVTDIRHRTSVTPNPQLERVLDDYLAWARPTFSHQSTIGAAKHLVYEIEELNAEPTDGQEYADCVMLAVFTLDRLLKAADVASINLVTEITQKLAVNQQRTFGPLDADGVPTRDREAVS